MNLVFTDHGRAALIEHVGPKPHKMDGLLAKAWRSTERLLPGDVCNPSYYAALYPDTKFEYRKLMGMVYVFALGVGNARLITVHPPAKGATKTKPRLIYASQYP